jgi:checkpoint serine/threonine-protein kinase
MNAFPEDQLFISSKKSDPSTDCWAIRNELPWSFDIDFYGIASIIHVMFFGI